jgi:hypothetical protein
MIVCRDAGVQLNQSNENVAQVAPSKPLRTRENRPDFAFSGESLWTIPVGNLWIKKVIEWRFFYCAVSLVSISIASEVRGTSIRERVRIVETERALQSASSRTKFSGTRDELLQDAWLVRARRLEAVRKALVSRSQCPSGAA